MCNGRGFDSRQIHQFIMNNISNNNTKTIVVAGGGVTGYITALQAKQCYPSSNVTIIASDKIGILGAGEGTTPPVIETLKSVGIDMQEIIKKANGTVKAGIAFQGWTGDSSYYYHGFEDYLDLGPEMVGENMFNYGKYFPEHYYLEHLTRYGFESGYSCAEIMNGNKVPIELHKDQTATDHGTEYLAMHYDVGMLVKLLREHAISQGIHTREGIIVDIIQSSDGNISSLQLDGGEKISCDFVFDCTGFRRFIIKKLDEKLKFINTNDTLPVNSAIAYRMPHTGTGGYGINGSIIRPYTVARAMQYGWEWTIPVWEDLRRGYIYDDTTCSDDQAYDEVCTMYNRDVDIINKFKFDSGYLENFWVKNCAAIGLAGGFFEPLEATAGMQIVGQLDMLLPCMFMTGDKYRKMVNHDAREYMEHIHDFILVHYINNKNQNDFWRKMKCTDKLQETVAMLLDEYMLPNITHRHMLQRYNMSVSAFQAENWLAVLKGIDMIESKTSTDPIYEHGVKQFRDVVKSKISNWADHSHAIKLIHS